MKSPPLGTTRERRPMDCNDVAARVWDWLDNELGADEWADIEAHLHDCTGCTEHVAFARHFLDRVRVATPAGDVGSLRERVRAALRDAG
jgi:hypothetical protein